ncbi:hypothetical protein GCM10009721_27180 [Terrabacter tumescens]|uniref:Lipoprotein n=1 Tax=Terrabacter tumescens TaxID=60443 RepID=A0ABQ2I6A1_9MICO|nr:hypothetical protein GCM10009721_27180 [Terrabacter tumescens]
MPGLRGAGAGRLSPVKRRIPAPAPARRPSTRRVTTVLAGVALALATTGCQVNSPVQTDVAYVPADGVPANVGELALRDLALIGDGSGTVVISGSAVNLGDQDMTVKIAAQADPNATTAPTGSEISLRPQEQVALASKGLQLSGVKTKPGGLVPVTVTSSVGGTTVVKVPVLAPKDYYSTVTPAPTGS